MAVAILIMAVVLATAQLSAAQQAPAFACAVTRDYYAKTKTECAAADCNAAQRNIGGEVIVLDTDSYGYTNCQGCNPANPASCCQRCKDTDGCNAWTVCTLPGGCGSGCKKYVESFGPNWRASDNGGKTFGNFKSCDGDKWPASMCTLKFINFQSVWSLGGIGNTNCCRIEQHNCHSSNKRPNIGRHSAQH